MHFKTYYIQKSRRNITKNKKLKKMNKMTWNNEFELPDCCYSVSYPQDYIECIIKKHELV